MCPSQEKKKEGKQWGNGQRWSIFICELCTDILHCFEDTRLLPLFLTCPTFLCKTNICTSPQEWATFPLDLSGSQTSLLLLLFSHPLLSSPIPTHKPPTSILSLSPIVMNKKCAKLATESSCLLGERSSHTTEVLCSCGQLVCSHSNNMKANIQGKSIGGEKTKYFSSFCRGKILNSIT